MSASGLSSSLRTSPMIHLFEKKKKKKERRHSRPVSPLESVFSYLIWVDLWSRLRRGQSHDFIWATWAVCLPRLSTLAVPKQRISRRFRTVCLALNLKSPAWHTSHTADCYTHKHTHTHSIPFDAPPPHPQFLLPSPPLLPTTLPHFLSFCLLWRINL